MPLVAVLWGCDQTNEWGTGDPPFDAGDAGDSGTSDDPRDPVDTGNPEDPNADGDGDGFSRAAGDCDDSSPSINPAAFEVADNGRDDDCDGQVDVVVDCDCGDDTDLPAGLDLCGSRGLLDWEERFQAPFGGGAAGVRRGYGTAGNGLTPRQGCGYTILSTGYVDVEDCDPVWDCPGGKRQPGTDLSYDGGEWSYCEGGEADPAPGGGDGTIICDTHQLLLRLRAPSNANGFSFDFLYLSTEYPEYVDVGFNDTFYAIIDRPSSGERRNISFDEQESEIEVDNAFFEDPPTTDVGGSGYDGLCNDETGRNLCGSSTGWLRTSWNIDSGEEFTLTFSIHDEGDGYLDSAVILDNFAWSAAPVEEGTDILY